MYEFLISVNIIQFAISFAIHMQLKYKNNQFVLDIV